jgi:hypothetical protein
MPVKGPEGDKLDLLTKINTQISANRNKMLRKENDKKMISDYVWGNKKT